jgi:cell fate (sporulation/competence/biofilm development) regulator YlbF (YheA/YmcA/DUF963 family)
VDDREKDAIENQMQFINLLNELTHLKRSGENPSEELIKQARKIGQAAKVPDFLLRLI